MSPWPLSGTIAMTSHSISAVQSDHGKMWLPVIQGRWHSYRAHGGDPKSECSAHNVKVTFLG